MLIFILVFNSCTSAVKQNSEGLACWSALNAQKLGVQSLTGEMVMKACKTIDKNLIEANVSTPEGIEHAVAQNMAHAWFITHEGTIKDKMWKTKLINIFQPGKECMIIYKLPFAPTPIFDTSYPGITYNDMNLYFSKTYFSSFPRTDGKPGNLRYTYGEYVQSKAGEGFYWFVDENNDGQLNEVIQPGKSYAISVASPNLALFGKSGFPKTDSNILIFSTYEQAIKMGCREFVD